MKTDTNYRLGLAAIAGDGDPHHGPVLIAVRRLQDILDVTPAEAGEIDAMAMRFAAEQGIPNPEPGEIVSNTDSRDQVAAAILATCGRLHFIAHDVIIGAYALMAIREIGSGIPEAIVQGILGNLLRMESAPPGIFHKYGPREIVEMESGFSDFNPGASESDLVESMLALLRAVPETNLGFGFRVQETHAITHTHALIWLRRNGFEAIYRKGLKPWFFRMFLLRDIALSRISGARKAPFEPVGIGSARFWARMDGLHGDQHLFKATLALFELREWGFLDEDGFGFILNRKFPVLFSYVTDEFA